MAASFHGPLPAYLRVKEIFTHIEARAHELSKAQGHPPGRELEFWTQAEKETVGHTRAVLYEDEAGYEVLFQLPGFEPNEVEIGITPLELGLHALTRRRMSERPAVWREFSEHEAYRQVRFPSPVDNETVETSLDHGILRVRVNKRQS